MVDSAMIPNDILTSLSLLSNSGSLTLDSLILPMIRGFELPFVPASHTRVLPCFALFGNPGSKPSDHAKSLHST